MPRTRPTSAPRRRAAVSPHGPGPQRPGRGAPGNVRLAPGPGPSAGPGPYRFATTWPRPGWAWARRNTRRSSARCSVTLTNRPCRSACMTCRATAAPSTNSACPLDPQLCQGLRAQARQLGVSAASLFHWRGRWCWRRPPGKDEVVFGTVLMGRMQGGEGDRPGAGHVYQHAAVAGRPSTARTVLDGRAARPTPGSRTCCPMNTRRWPWPSAAAGCRRRHRCSASLLNYRHSAPASGNT